ncbi:MAG: hypothetical protein AAF702_43240 [Chloroflexota bacterium]
MKNLTRGHEKRQMVVEQALLQGLDRWDILKLPEIDASIETISLDIKVIIGQWRREQNKNSEQWMTLSTQRLSQMIRVIWPEAQQGNTRAISQLATLIKQQAKFMGLNRAEATQIVYQLKSTQTAGLLPVTPDEWQIEDERLATTYRQLIGGITS